MTTARPEPVEHRVPVDDAVLTVEEHSPTRRGVGPAVVFLPALGVPLAYYRPLLTRWADRGRRVLAVELRGMPQSPVPDLRRARFGYADLVRTDVPAVAALAGDDVALVGHSLGGQLALLATAAGTVRPTAVVTVATGTSSPSHLPRGRRWQRRAAVTTVRTVSAALTLWPGHRLGFAGRQPRSLMRDWAHEARYGRYQLHGDPTDYETALSGLAVPALMLDVIGDRMIPASAVDHLAARVGGPVTRATIRTTSPSDHFCWARRSPDQVLDAVETWLATQQR